MRFTWRGAPALIVLVGVLLFGACGDGTEAGGKLGVNITSTPPATITVDGKPAGTTPVSIALAPGSHEVTFEREGFIAELYSLDVGPEQENALAVELVLDDAEDDDALAALALALDMEEWDALDLHPIVTRGSTGQGITLYWPQGEVRADSLETYRVDVTADYQRDGQLVFRIDDEVLYREAFLPEGDVTVAALPDAVIGKVKKKTTFTWGIEFDDPGRTPVLTDFTVVEKRRVEKELARLEKKKRFVGQPALVQELLKADVLRKHGLLVEALQRYLAIARQWPDSTQAYRGLLTMARLLGLPESELYQQASQIVQNGPPAPGTPPPAALEGQEVTDLATDDSTPPPAPDEPPDPAEATALLDLAASLDAASQEARIDAKQLRTIAEETEAKDEELAEARGILEQHLGVLEQAVKAVEDAEEAIRVARTQGEVPDSLHETLAQALLERENALIEVQNAEQVLRAVEQSVGELQERTGGISAKDAKSAANALNRLAMELRRDAREARRAAEAILSGGAVTSPPVRSAHQKIMERIAVLRERATRLRQAAEAAKPVEADLETAQAELEAARQRVAEIEARAREAEKAAQEAVDESGGSGPDPLAGAAEIYEELRVAREALGVAEVRVSELMEQLSTLLEATGGLSVAEALAAADSAGQLADELQKRADEIAAGM